MFASANVEDYAWMSLPNSRQSLEELKQFARVSGKDAGAGKCLWADEVALSTISDGLRITLLIVNDQASRGGRKRSPDKETKDGRFISIGNYSRCVVLHRTRRQHYNAVRGRCGAEIVNSIKSFCSMFISKWVEGRSM